MIGYYVHHVGAGHVTRATAIARHLRTPVTALSSGAASRDWPGEWIELERDDEPAPSPHADHRAGDAFHWAPAHHAGLRSRMAQIAAWIDRARPALMVVDVSVEVATLARLMGIPVVIVAQPGIRDDGPHRLGYRLATAIVAAWPDWVPVPRQMSFLSDRLRHVGAFSRFDARPVPERRTRADGRRRVLVLTGRGGTSVTRAQIAAARAATPGWSWKTIGPPGELWASDPWPDLGAADVVVTHAGQNAVAEVAAARRPAIVLVQERPYDEQRHTADVLKQAGLAITRRSWPAPEEWPALLRAAAQHDGGKWIRWAPGDGAERAARLLDSLAHRRELPPA
jgi:Glycosyltransferase family 28 C-terminal domain